MFPKPTRNFGQKCPITRQIEARVFNLKAGNERVRKPGHVVRKWLLHFNDCISWCLRRVRSFRHSRIFDLNELEATLSTAGACQSKSLASCTRWLRCIALHNFINIRTCCIMQTLDGPSSFVSDKRHTHVLKAHQASCCAARLS